jgi:hypothetical protein
MNADLKPIKTRADEWAAPSKDYPYIKLREIDVTKRMEKKNGFTYLSWAFAVDTLLQHDPQANWTYPAPTYHGESKTMMVYCAVTAFGKTMQAHLPVMNHMNKAIPDPNAFEINTAMQRCLVKAIALHGLALHVFAGEDLPASSDARSEPEDVDRKLVEAAVKELRLAFALDASEEEKAEAVFAVHLRVAHEADLYSAIGDALASNERAALKAYVSAYKKQMAQQPVTRR